MTTTTPVQPPADQIVTDLFRHGLLAHTVTTDGTAQVVINHPATTVIITVHPVLDSALYRVSGYLDDTDRPVIVLPPADTPDAAAGAAARLVRERYEGCTVTESAADAYLTDEAALTGEARTAIITTAYGTAVGWATR